MIIKIGNGRRGELNLVPRVSHLTTLSLLAPGGCKMRDPGNEVGENLLCIPTLLLGTVALKVVAVASEWWSLTRVPNIEI